MPPIPPPAMRMWWVMTECSCCRIGGLRLRFRISKHISRHRSSSEFPSNPRSGQLSGSALHVVAKLWLSVNGDRLESLVGWAKARTCAPCPPGFGLWWARFALPTLRRIASALLLSMLTLAPSLATEIAPQDRRSAYADMSRESKAMQDDDAANPGMLAVLDGEALWNRKVGAAHRSCADCHGDATQSMRGVAARYPAFD